MKIQKNELKVKAGFSWDNIGKVVDCEGDEYTINRVGGSQLKIGVEGLATLSLQN